MAPPGMPKTTSAPTCSSDETRASAPVCSAAAESVLDIAGALSRAVRARLVLDLCFFRPCGCYAGATDALAARARREQGAGNKKPPLPGGRRGSVDERGGLSRRGCVRGGAAWD